MLEFSAVKGGYELAPVLPTEEAVQGGVGVDHHALHQVAGEAGLMWADAVEGSELHLMSVANQKATLAATAWSHGFLAGVLAERHGHALSSLGLEPDADGAKPTDG